MSDDNKKSKNESKNESKDESNDKWDGVRHTSTKTEVEANPDRGNEELFESESALIVIQGDLVGRVFRIAEGRTVIGRHPTAQIQVHQRAVSSMHAEIRRSEDVVIVADLGSTNGTVVNRNKISAPVALQSGDLIRIGNSVFRYADRQIEANFTESMHQQMTRDNLTGTFNRAYTMKALRSSMEIAKTGYPLSLVMFDLDHFKKVNDTYGHLAGDYVLKESCRVILDKVVRSEDVLGRYGGEEFVLMMPNCSLEDAATAAERIRATLENHSFEFDGQVIPVTTSLGVAAWKPKMQSPEDFIQVVDDLLYESKKGGRNRVSIVTE